jgi:hypothetical protein
MKHTAKSKALAATLATAVLAIGCNSRPQPATGGVMLSPSNGSASTPAAEAQASEVNACNFLSAADAEAIEGAPMKPSPIHHSSDVCLYVEVTPRPDAMGPANLSLTLIESKSVEAENRSWARLKEVRELAAGQKNVKVLSGLGDEAYFTGNTEKGKVGVAAVIVRKGRSHFTLDSQVIEYRASPDAMKSIARRIVERLP